MSELTPRDREIYAWQIDLPGFGDAAQLKLKNSRVFISRAGGLGGLVAMELAAAGIGAMVIAHGGVAHASDFNRQLLLKAEGEGLPRVDSFRQRLLEFRPDLDLVLHDTNVDADNALELIRGCHLVIDCAPLFQERLAMNDAAVKLGIPLVEAAMYGMQAQLSSHRPGLDPCLRCLFPQVPELWKRRFPVLGAVSGSVACLAAIEAVKLLTGLPTCLEGDTLLLDLERYSSQRLRLGHRRSDCAVCGQRKKNLSDRSDQTDRQGPK